MVLELARSLQAKLPRERQDNGDLTIYMDNYYSTNKLFSKLREMGIGAVGTLRSNRMSADMKEKLKDKAFTKTWNAKWAKPVGDVLNVLWIDSNEVKFLTTVHDGTEMVNKKRRRPKATTPMTKRARAAFGDRHAMHVEMPGVAADYNKYMGYVDIVDQLRSNYKLELRCRRNWISLFLFLLDVVICNCFVLCKHADVADRAVTTNHAKFRNLLISQLLRKADRLQLEASRAKRKLRSSTTGPVPLTKTKQLPVVRHELGGHTIARLDAGTSGHARQRRCVYCTARGFKRWTTKWCPKCKAALCSNKKRACWNKFHEE